MSDLNVFKLSAEEIQSDAWAKARAMCNHYGYNVYEIAEGIARFRMLRAEARARAMAEEAAKLPPPPQQQPATLVNFKDVKQWWDANTQSWTKPGIVYIGRAMTHLNLNLPASPYGNPFRIGEDTDDARADVIETYRDWIQLPAQAHLLHGLDALRGQMLVCWCRPRRCHGEVLLDLMRAKPSYADVLPAETTGEESDQYQPMLNMSAF